MKPGTPNSKLASGNSAADIDAFFKTGGADSPLNKKYRAIQFEARRWICILNRSIGVTGDRYNLLGAYRYALRSFLNAITSRKESIEFLPGNSTEVRLIGSIFDLPSAEFVGIDLSIKRLTNDTVSVAIDGVFRYREAPKQDGSSGPGD